MSKYGCIIVFIIYLLYGDLQAQEKRVPAQLPRYYKPPIETKDIKLERAFGSELYGTKDKFLIVDNIRGFCTNINNDILIADEGFIKVYDSNGEGKRILGGKGQGPGEYTSITAIFCGPSGYILILSGKSEDSYVNIFSPDYKFLKKMNVLSNKSIKDYIKNIFPKTGMIRVQEAIPVDGNTIIFGIHIACPDSVKRSVLLLQYSIKKNEVTDYLKLTDAGSLVLRKGTATSSSPDRVGIFFWSLLPDNRIIYLSSDDEKYINEKEGYINIHLVSFETKKDKIINVFNPNLKPIEKDIEKKYSKNMTDKDSQEKYSAIVSLLKKREYYPDITSITIDRQYLFIYLFNFKNPSGNNRPVKVVDLYIGKEVYFTEFPDDFSYISQGYIYSDDYDKNGYIEIRKYKLNPSVYGK